MRPRSSLTITGFALISLHQPSRGPHKDVLDVSDGLLEPEHCDVVLYQVGQEEVEEGIVAGNPQVEGGGVPNLGGEWRPRRYTRDPWQWSLRIPPAGRLGRWWRNGAAGLAPVRGRVHRHGRLPGLYRLGWGYGHAGCGLAGPVAGR